MSRGVLSGSPMSIIMNFLKKAEKATKELSDALNQLSDSLGQNGSGSGGTGGAPVPKPVTGYIGSTNIRPRNSVYGWAQLDDDGKAAYKAVRDACLRFDPYAEFDVDRTDIDFISEVYKAVRVDNPKIFWVDFIHLKWQYSMNGNVRINIPYYYSEKEAKRLIGDMKDRINQIADECRLTEGNDYDRTVRLYEYITSHVEYNEDDMLSAHNVVGPILKGKAVCEGVSMAMNLILNRYGICCNTVFGSLLSKNTDPSIEDHAWNIVSLDGSFYHLDATQDLKEQSHAYLNVSDAVMRRTHRYRKVVDCDSMDLNYHRMNGILLPLDQADAMVLDFMSRRIPRFEVRLTEPADIGHFIDLAKRSGRTLPAYRITTVPGTYSFIFVR